MHVEWVLEDATRHGGVEAVVQSLHCGLRSRGVESSIRSWNDSSWSEGTPRRSATSWLLHKIHAAVARSRRAKRASSDLAESLASDPGLLVILDPGSMAVARNLTDSPRWGIHVHWSPDLIMRPWRHVDWSSIPMTSRPIVYARLRAVGRGNTRILRAAPFLITLTGSHTRLVQSVRARAVYEIPNPVETGPLRQRRGREPNAPVTIGFVGRLAWEKGPDILVEAVSQLGGDTGETRLVVAGTGPLAGALAERTHELRMRGVRFLGWVDTPRSVFEEIDVFVLPSRTEAMGLVLVEALAAGCRVVATDAGDGVRDVLENGRLGQIVPPRDAPALARAIEGAIAAVRADERTADERREAIVRKHDPEVVIGAWVALLDGPLR